ncbi:dihydrolipoyl dehydrogenase [Aquicoccus sp. SCR17]|nr:dihydrolipoyl dehydrogenase [Carideicomes alvinocaridis]
MTTRSCDVAVIGAGTAGLAAERAARHAGASTLLIDPDFAGTTCATVGCMPSKLLIAAAHANHGIARAGEFGIEASGRVDGPAVMTRLRKWRDTFAQGVRDNIARLPEGVCITGRARFAGPSVLELEDGTRIEAGAVVVATGSAAAIPGPFKALEDLVLTNRSVFELEDLPESVGVIGAGPVGVELAQALARLGVRVSLYDSGDSIAKLPEETTEALKPLLEQDFPVHLGTTPEPSREGDMVVLSHDGTSERFDRVLLAAGRPPSLEGLDLAATGLELDDHGMPEVNAETLQCGDLPIFMAGDANAIAPLLHEASDEGAAAGRNAAAHPDLKARETQVPLAITFTDPSAATIGTIPDPEDQSLVTGRADYADQGRAKVEARAGGLVRIHAKASDGTLMGADLCLPEGEHLAHLLAWTIASGKTASEVLDLPFYHPTLEEGLQAALREICRKTAAPRPWSRDEGPTPGF